MQTSKYLIVVDMQNDFIDGALGTKEAQAIVPRAAEKIKNFDGTVVFTMDTHTPDYLNTSEGRHLPVKHCIKGTNGWELCAALLPLQEARHAAVFEKGTFGSVKLAESLLSRYQEGALSSVELLGLCTDICVVSNALLLKAFMPELPVFVDASCCAGVTPEKHQAALETMRSCQIEVLNA